MSAEGVREFHAHVPQPAKRDDANRLTGPHLPVTQRRIRRDASAEKRGDGGQVQLVGDAQRERFVDDDTLGVAAVGDAAAVGIGAVVRENREALAELLEAFTAAGARAARVDHAADAGQVARRNRVTAVPTSTTFPTISWPGTHG